VSNLGTSTDLVRDDRALGGFGHWCKDSQQGNEKRGEDREELACHGG
jgi:hypothetical protein